MAHRRAAEKIISRLTTLIAALALAASATGAFAQDYPTRPIRVLVPYPAGGPSDVAMRLLAEPLSRQLGQSVIIENRSGGGGRIGTEAALQAEPDGYTLMVGGTATLVVIPAAQQVRYDPLKDFIPLGQIFYAPPMLVVRSSLGLKNMPEIIARAKADPGKFTVGSAGVGTNTHVAILLWAREAGVQITHVPYRSTPLWVNDAIGGQIDSGFGEWKSLAGQIEAGGLTPIAVTSTKRIAQLPNLPTMAEIGLPGVHTENWFGLLALGKTQLAIVERLKTAVKAAQGDPAYLAALARDKSNPGEPGADAFAKVVQDDVARMAPILRNMGKELN